MITAIMTFLGIVLAGLVSVLMVGVGLVASFLPEIIMVLIIVLLVKLIRGKVANN